MNYLTEDARFQRGPTGFNQDWRDVRALVDDAVGDTGFLDDNRASRRFIQGGWNGVRSFEEALELALVGWPEGARRVAEWRDRFEATIAGSLPIPDVTYDVTGDFIDIGRFLTGEPEDFGSETETEFNRDHPSAKIVRVVVNIGASSKVQPEWIERRGAAVAAFVELLERLGKRVEVDAVVAIFSSAGVNGRGASAYALVETEGYRHADKWLARVRVKEAGEPLQLDKLTFMLAHPSGLRRMMFAGLEAAPEEAVKFFQFRDTLGWYGVPVNIPMDDPEAEPHERRRGDVYLPAMHANSGHNAAWWEQWIRTKLEGVGVKWTDAAQVAEEEKTRRESLAEQVKMYEERENQATVLEQESGY